MFVYSAINYTLYTIRFIYYVKYAKPDQNDFVAQMQYNEIKLVFCSSIEPNKTKDEISLQDEINLNSYYDEFFKNHRYKGFFDPLDKPQG